MGIKSNKHKAKIISLQIFHGICLIVCFVFLLRSVYQLICNKWTEDIRRKQIIYSLFGMICFIITQILLVIETLKLSENYTILSETASDGSIVFWVFGQIFLYLIFVDRLKKELDQRFEYSQLLSYKKKNLGCFIFILFIFGSIFLIFAIISIFDNTIIENYNLRIYILYILTCIDIILCIYLLTLFCKQIMHVSYSTQKVNLNINIGNDTMTNDDNNNNITAGNNNITSINNDNTGNSRIRESLDDTIPDNAMDYQKLTKDNNDIESMLGKDDKILINILTQHIILSNFGIISSLIVLFIWLYSLTLTEFLNYNKHKIARLMIIHILWSINCILNILVIYCNFEFAKTLYKILCKCCHLKCRLCCIKKARNKVIHEDDKLGFVL